MWWIIVPVILLVSIIIYLLFAPFFIEIDSSRDLYRVRFHRLASLAIVLHDESIYAAIEIVRWKKEYDLLTPGKQTPAKPEKKAPSGKPGKKSGFTQKNWKRIRKAVNSFTITQCHILIDTGDMPTNGLLYPLFYLLSWWTGKTILVNFMGENLVILQVKNSVARMLWAYIR